MAKVPKGGESQGAGTPSEFAQVTPRDLYPTSDIRFVMVEVGKLTANVERLIADVKSQGDKIDGLRHQTSFIKGGLAVTGIFLTFIIYLFSSKGESLLTALKSLFH